MSADARHEQGGHIRRLAVSIGAQRGRRGEVDAVEGGEDCRLAANDVRLLLRDPGVYVTPKDDGSRTGSVQHPDPMNG
jgi:hypothetical protein